MRILFTPIIILLISLVAPAQTVILKVDETKLTEPRFGPNLKRFTHAYFQAAAIASGDKAGAEINYGKSLSFAFGIRTKFKIGNVYSLGYEIEQRYTTYNLKQKEGKIFPDTVLNNVAGRLDYFSLGLGFYERINLDPNRGNFLGTYIDLGIMGEWSYSIRNIAKNKFPDGTKVKSIQRGLPYTRNLNAKLFARIGYSRISAHLSWRFTELFKNDSGYPNLPTVAAGVDIDLF